MNDDFNAALVDEIMNCIIQTEEYIVLLTNDPLVKEKRQSLEAIFARIAPSITREEMRDLEDAALNLANVYSHISILYGIHVADAIRDIAVRPSDLTRFVMARREELTT